MLHVEEANDANKIYKAYQDFSNKSKIVSILASLSTDKALSLVSEQLESNDKNSKQNALKSLANWKQNNVLPLLFETATKGQDKSVKQQAFKYYLNKSNSI